MRRHVEHDGTVRYRTEDGMWIWPFDRYVQSALERRHVSAESGIQLTVEEVARWDAIFAALEEATRPLWLEDPVLLAASAFYDAHGHLELSQWGKDASPEERALAEGLAILRRARYATVLEKRTQRLQRRQLSSRALSGGED